MQPNHDAIAPDVCVIITVINVCLSVIHSIELKQIHIVYPSNERYLQRILQGFVCCANIILNSAISMHMTCTLPYNNLSLK